MKNLKSGCFVLLFMMSFYGQCQIRLNTRNTEVLLYLGSGDNQSLVVGLGGSEGGNAWASDYWKSTRETFISKGYAFLAVGYFGSEGTPPLLEKIAIEDVRLAIDEALKDGRVDDHKVAVVGGSRGADLALLLGSYYKDIRCIVGLVPSHAVFPGNTAHLSTSSWTYRGEALPFVPVNEEAVPYLMNRNLRGAFETMLKDTLAEQKALIRVEKINGPVLLLSATKDEICPSTPMSDKIIARLRQHHFGYTAEHLAIEGGHSAPLRHFEEVFRFLEKHY